MQLNDRYYIDFIMSKRISEINKQNVREALEQKDSLDLSYVQLMEAMLITDHYPSVTIEYAVSGRTMTEIFTFNEEIVVFLLNSMVCTTEFLPTTTEGYTEFRRLKSDYARKALMLGFEKYLMAGSNQENGNCMQIP